jgi:hypothetical protein
MHIDHGLNDRVPLEIRGLLYRFISESTSKDLKEGLELFWLVSQALFEPVSLRARHDEDKSG